jgi:hypothetical protein
VPALGRKKAENWRSTILFSSLVLLYATTRKLLRSMRSAGALTVCKWLVVSPFDRRTDFKSVLQTPIGPKLRHYRINLGLDIGRFDQFETGVAVTNDKGRPFVPGTGICER